MPNGKENVIAISHTINTIPIKKKLFKKGKKKKLTKFRVEKNLLKFT